MESVRRNSTGVFEHEHYVSVSVVAVLPFGYHEGVRDGRILIHTEILCCLYGEGYRTGLFSTSPVVLSRSHLNAGSTLSAPRIQVSNSDM